MPDAHAATQQRSPGELRWGILATGHIARSFTEDLQRNGHNVVAVGSRSVAQAESFAADFGLARAHGSYEGLCADPEVDVVYVATPHPAHRPDALLALANDKHVLVEKPFTLNAGEAREVVAAARGRGRVLVEAMWTRFLPHMRYVHEVVDSGSIGDVLAVHAFHLQSLPTDPHHRLHDPGLGGGALLDLGVYPVSFAHDLLGAPDSVAAEATLEPTGVDVTVSTTLRHRGAALSSSLSSSVTGGPNTAVVLGSRGRLEIHDTWYTPTSVTLHDPDGEVVDTFAAQVAGRGMQFQALEVERLVAARETESPLMTWQGSIEVMEVLDTVRDRIGVRYPGE